jgi:hypothetical protein
MFHILIVFSALAAIIVFITMIVVVQHFFLSKKEIESVDTDWCILHNSGHVEDYVYLSQRIK